jgi:transcriptional regulator with XRE-family HTH domain
MTSSGKNLTVRNCARCHHPLRRYNKGRYCGGCSGAGVNSGEPVPSDNPGPDVGSRIRALRQRRGLTLDVLAGLCGVTGSYLSMIENGKRGYDPRYSLILRLASALRVTPAELVPGIRAAETDSPAVSPVGQETSEDTADVLRRLRRLSSPVDPEMVGYLQNGLDRAIAEYETADHRSLAQVMVKQRGLIDHVLDQCHNSEQRRRLYRVAGGTSGLLGYLAVGRGDFPLALRAWARGTHSFCEYYAGRYDKALALAGDGLKYAGSGPQAVRLTVNGTARAMGRLGDARGVERAVGQAQKFLAGNEVPAGVPSSISLGCYSQAQAASNAATAYLALGMPEKVQHYIGIALPDISRSASPWSRSLVMIDLAFSLIQARHADLEQASGLVLDALSISSGRPVISVQLRAAEFARAAAGRLGSCAQVSAVKDAISGLRAAGAGNE